MNFDALDIITALPAFALVLFRITGLMLTAPVLSAGVVPMRFRAALAAWTAGIMFPLVAPQVPAEVTLAAALPAGLMEMMIGAAIGLALSILLSAGDLAGLIVGQQAGVAIAEVFDPAHDEQSASVTQVYALTFTVVFLLLGGHRAAIAALLDTYAAIPLLSFRFGEPVVLMLVEVLAAAFVLGVRLGAPVLLALFLVGVATAFLSRTMPQLNVLTVGFTLRLLIGLGVAALALAACGDLLADAVWDVVESVRVTFGVQTS